ncbi:MAG: hypothetical protein ACR2MT_13690, partial [Aurantibacter sp.]
MKIHISILALVLFALVGCQSFDKSRSDSNFVINVSFSDSASTEAKDGRLLLMLSDNDEGEPRFQINDGLNTQIVFGMNVSGMGTGQKITFDEEVFGFPYPSLADVPPGEYNVQALLHVYETFN